MEKYYFSLFGTPAANGAWGYRMEGHHISQNYTITNGQLIGAPSFFGSNPATAYADILTSDKRVAALAGQPSGLTATQMNGRQYEALRGVG